jgi:hypothetical protein
MAIRLKIGTPELIRTSQSHQVVGLIMAILTETVMATLKDLFQSVKTAAEADTVCDCPGDD